MILYSSQAHTQAMQQMQVSMQHEHHLQIIKAFEPEFIVAESSEENTLVMEQAMLNCAGFGLYYPDIEQIGLERLQNHYQKVILLDANHPLRETVSEYGLVVHSQANYEAECIHALNNVLS